MRHASTHADELPDALQRRNEPERAARVAGAALEASLAAHDDRRAVDALHLLASCALLAGDTATASGYLERARTRADAFGDHELTAYGQSLEVQLLTMTGDIEGALALCSSALETLGESEPPSFARTSLLHQRATTCQWVADYATALAGLFEALEYRGERDREVMRGVALNSIASIYQRLGSTELALEYFLQAHDVSQACGDGRGTMYSACMSGIALLDLGRAVEAIEPLDESLTLARELSAPDTERKSLTGLAIAREQLGDPDGALLLAEQALANAEERGSDRGRISVLTLIGSIRLARQEYDAAEGALRRALAIGEKTGERMLLLKTHELLSALCEARGDDRGALDHHRASIAIAETIGGGRKHQEVARVRFDAERRGADRERESHRARERALERDLASRTDQLAHATTALLQKQESLERVRRELQAIARKGVRESRRVKGLLAQVETMMEAGGAWQAFDRRFSELHGEFLRTIAERAPDLTPTELKICTLLRSNCSTKEIASILAISRHTVDGHRSSIRRKLGLAADENLASYLVRIG